MYYGNCKRLNISKLINKCPSSYYTEYCIFRGDWMLGGQKRIEIELIWLESQSQFFFSCVDRAFHLQILEFDSNIRIYGVRNATISIPTPPFIHILKYIERKPSVTHCVYCIHYNMCVIFHNQNHN